MCSSTRVLEEFGRKKWERGRRETGRVRVKKDRVIRHDPHERNRNANPSRRIVSCRRHGVRRLRVYRWTLQRGRHHGIGLENWAMRVYRITMRRYWG